jgi:lipopolysaccharide export system permease protein
MLKNIDRYILQNELAAFGVVVLIVSALLALENVPRVWFAVSGTSAPASLLLQMLVALLPEYLAVGFLIASFLAPAWTIRTLALRGEWQVLASVGLAPWRIMLIPMMIAAVATCGQFGIRLALEPLGERTFSQLGVDLERGAFGLPFHMRDFVKLDYTTAIYVAPAEGGDRPFGKVFLRRGDEVFTARSARAARDMSGRVEVELFDGREITHDEEGRSRVLDFSNYRFTFSPHDASPEPLSMADRLNQLPLGELLHDVAKESRIAGRRPATAAFMARMSNALFCLILPWIAFVLAQPPRRERSGAAALLGIGAIVLFLRTNSLVASHFESWPVTAASLHMGMWIVATVALVRFGMMNDEGIVDHGLNRAYANMVRARHRLTSWMLAASEALRRRGDWSHTGGHIR